VTDVKSSKTLDGYGLTVISYAKSVTVVTNLSDKTVIGEADAKAAFAGLADGDTLVLSAPASSKPKRLRRKAEDEKDGKTAAVGSDRAFEEYAGFTPQNAITKYLAAEDGTKKKKLAWEYMEGNGTEILKSKPWTQLKRDLVKKFLSSEQLNVDKESQVLDAAIAWAKAEMKRNPPKTASDAKESEQLKAALGDLLYVVRLPLVELNDIAVKVAPLGLLDQVQVLALFTYLGQRAAAKDSAAQSRIPVDASLKMFTTKPRTPRVIVKTVDFSPAGLSTTVYTLDQSGRGYSFEAKVKCSIVGISAQVAMGSDGRAAIYTYSTSGQLGVNATLLSNKGTLGWVEGKFSPPIQLQPGVQYSVMIYGTGQFGYQSVDSNPRIIEPFRSVYSKSSITSDNTYQAGIRLKVMV